MHPDTWDVRKQARLLNDDRFAQAIADLYRQHEVMGPDDVDDETLTADETRDALFGGGHPEHVNRELNDQIMEMTRPSGRVYEALDDGATPLSLCSTKVTRKLFDAQGVEYVTSRTGRFVSQQDAVVAAYRLEPQFQRLERTMERVAGVIAEDVRRIPALAAHTPGMIRRSHRVMQNELPPPPAQPAQVASST